MLMLVYLGKLPRSNEGLLYMEGETILNDTERFLARERL